MFRIRSMRRSRGRDPESVVRSSESELPRRLWQASTARRTKPALRPRGGVADGRRDNLLQLIGKGPRLSASVSAASPSSFTDSPSPSTRQAVRISGRSMPRRVALQSARPGLLWLVQDLGPSARRAPPPTLGQWFAKARWWRLAVAYSPSSVKLDFHDCRGTRIGGMIPGRTWSPYGSIHVAGRALCTPRIAHLAANGSAGASTCRRASQLRCHECHPPLLAGRRNTPRSPTPGGIRFPSRPLWP